MKAVVGQLMLHVKGNEQHAAEGKHQSHQFDQVQERVPAQVAQHKIQDHRMKLAIISWGTQRIQSLYHGLTCSIQPGSPPYRLAGTFKNTIFLVLSLQ